MSKKSIIVSFVILVVVGMIAFWVIKYTNPPVEKLLITNFTECAEAGYPVMESYPRQCRTPDGNLFVEVLAKCFTGGCSGQICSDEPGAISTCEYREEYACYKSAKCERQMDGGCGWTQTAQL